MLEIQQNVFLKGVTGGKKKQTKYWQKVEIYKSNVKYTINNDHF